MVKTLNKVIGVVLLVVGLWGLAEPNLLGMHLTPVHNVIHLLTAAVALYMGFVASVSAARTFSIAFGAVYLLLGVLGFVAPGLVTSVIGHPPVGAGELTPDNVVHVLLGGAFLAVGLLQSRALAPRAA
ncbi:MAG TPA: hypothetical protein VMT87_05955 [Vicinamibacteria bacterium]|nr:hypothetical protein [Vicinamibacteria bacterium]